MTLDPEFAGFLSFLKEVGAPSTFDGTPEEARLRMAETIEGGWDRDAFPAVASVSEQEVGSIPTPVQIVRPVTEKASVPTVVLFHPGGFIVGAARLVQDVAQRLANEMEAVIVSVDYRLAPEHPFPAAPEDAVEVTAWAHAHISELGGDAARLAVAGESSGANLATVAARAMRDRGIPVAAQLLASPYTDFSRDYPSALENGAGFFLSKADLDLIRRTYLPDAEAARLPDASPARGDLAGTAPAVIGVAGFDPLRDDGTVYAAKLLQADVPVQLRVFPGLIHPFFGMAGVSAAARAAGDELIALFSAAIERSALVPASA
ncbi:alpha/beta hydrolase [Leucobacter weissii]|uniref:Alpha/beta hydrolase n=1 Tax=Leucobacter weissii TaxID=1983706 RepID=A0A939MNM2_9MICO|nr:alpha/beta hydrolase [Leucobacter weissii]MBO1901761.1 alpha/beta hydrolase [Leucobacter weissii]